MCRLLAVALNTMSILPQFTTERTKAQGNYVPCLSVQCRANSDPENVPLSSSCLSTQMLQKKWHWEKGAIRQGYMISRDQRKMKTGAPYSKIIKNFNMARAAHSRHGAKRDCTRNTSMKLILAAVTPALTTLRLFEGQGEEHLFEH